MGKISELTDKLIEDLGNELDKNTENVNLMGVVRENYDVWCSNLIPLLKANKKPVYQSLSDLLIECGYSQSNPELISVYFSRIKKARANLGNRKESIEKTSLHNASIKTIQPVACADVSTKPVKSLTEAQIDFEAEISRLDREKGVNFKFEGYDWSDRDNALLKFFQQHALANQVELTKLMTSGVFPNGSMHMTLFSKFKMKMKVFDKWW